MNPQQQQTLTTQFQHSFTRAQAHSQAALQALQVLLQQIQTIVAPQGVTVTHVIHTPMISSDRWKNVIAEATFSHPKGLQPAIVQFIYSASLGTESTSFTVTAMLEHRYDDILRGLNSNQVSENPDQIRALLTDVSACICGFRVS